MGQKATIFTDVATICIYDPDRLKHRVNDDQWGSYPEVAVDEMNAGNLMIVNIGSDGVYDLYVHDGPVAYPECSVSARLACSSGKFYVGPGEGLPGFGYGP